MKAKICFVTVLTICIVAALVFLFEQYGTKTADVFDGILIWKENIERVLI
ncbi:MAG: hypothetical protein HDT30_14950 [Clostridiales bacterium]|nr:hypothetical protein [Clostridiales bacterium]